MNRVTSVDECATAFVDGIIKRKRRVFVPRSLALVQAIRTITLSGFGDQMMRRTVAMPVSELEREVSQLGREFGRHSVAAGGREEAAAT